MVVGLVVAVVLVAGLAVTGFAWPGSRCPTSRRAAWSSSVRASRTDSFQLVLVKTGTWCRTRIDSANARP